MSCYLIRFYTHMYMCVICVNNKFLKVYHAAVYDALSLRKKSCFYTICEMLDIVTLDRFPTFVTEQKLANQKSNRHTCRQV